MIVCRLKLNSAWLLIGLAFFLAGCSTHFKIDLQQERSANLVQDLPVLQQLSAVSLPDPLTINDAVRIGLENNLDLRTRRIMAEINEESSLAERLKLLPQLNVRGEMARRDKHNQTEYYNPDTGQTVLSNTTTEELTRRAASATLTWNVLDFGLSYFRARQVVLDTEIKRMERLRQAQNLALDIVAAFWKSVLSEQALDHIAQLEAEVAGYMRKAEAMAAQKRMDPIMVKTIERDLASLAISSKSLQAEVSGSRIDLCNLMGLNPLTPFTLKRESFQEHLDAMPDPKTIDSARLELISLKNRPELFSADLEVRVRQDEARAALVTMFPGLRFDYGVNYDGNRYLVNHVWTSVGVGVMDNLLSLPARYQNLKAKDLGVELAQTQRLMLSAGVIAQAHLALHDYTVKEDLFQLQDKSYRLALELLEMTRQRHQLGVLPETALVQQMVETTVAKMARDRNLIELLNAYNTLFVTLGLEYSAWNAAALAAEDEFPPNINHDDIFPLQSEKISDIRNFKDKTGSYLTTESPTILISNENMHLMNINRITKGWFNMDRLIAASFVNFNFQQCLTNRNLLLLVNI